MAKIQNNQKDLWYSKKLFFGNSFSKSCILVLAVFALCFSASVNIAEAEKAPAVFKQLEDNVYKFQLDNGLRVLFFKRDHAPVFYAQTWVKVGSVDEAPEEYGLSKFIEYLAYKGKKNLGNKDNELEERLKAELESLQDIDHEIARARVAVLKSKLKGLSISNEVIDIYKKRGAIGLMAEANTDYTVYGVELPKTQLEFWCWVESDRLMHPVFNGFKSARRELEKEQKQQRSNGADGLLYHAMASLSSMPRLDRVRAIAWPPEVEEPSITQAFSFHDRYYRPDNIVLSIVGDLNPDDVEELTDKYFSALKERKKSIKRFEPTEPQQSRAVDIDVETQGNPQVVVGYQKPVWPNKVDVYFTVLRSMLGGGRPSMLSRELISKKRVAQSVFVTEAPHYRAPSVFLLGATPRRGVTDDRLLGEIYAVLDRTKTTLFDDKKMESAKRRVRVALFKDLKTNKGVAEFLGKSELLWGDWRDMINMYSVLNDTRARDLRQIARDYFAIDKRITLRQRTPRSR